MRIVILGTLAVSLLIAALIVRDRDKASIDSKQCQFAVESRLDHRRIWKEVGIILIASGRDERWVNSFIHDLLETIPPLRCENSQPVPAKEV